jgi:hypothetical protein
VTISSAAHIRVRRLAPEAIIVKRITAPRSFTLELAQREDLVTFRFEPASSPEIG